MFDAIDVPVGDKNAEWRITGRVVVPRSARPRHALRRLPIWHALRDVVGLAVADRWGDQSVLVAGDMRPGRHRGLVARRSGARAVRGHGTRGPRPAGRGLLIAEVRHADGTRQGVHYWNRLSDGLELDLTRAQFSRGAVVGIPEVVSRPVNTAEGRPAGAPRGVLLIYVGVSWKAGQQFDASWDRGSSFKLGLGKGQVIAGWDQGVTGMRVGGRRRITIRRCSRTASAAPEGRSDRTRPSSSSWT